MNLGIGNLILGGGSAGLAGLLGSVAEFVDRVAVDTGIVEAEQCLTDRAISLYNLGLWDQASAVWIPHAYKESKLYAAKGGSGVDLGFTRAGTKYRKAATYVEQVPYNLLSRSEEFDNASWVKNACTVTANSTTAPNSELSADSLLETIAVSGHFLRQSITKPIVATTYRFSVNVKANNRDWCLLQIGGTVSLAGVYFNVATGAIGSQRILGSEFSIVSSSIEAANNGFYKLTIVVTGTNTETSLLVDISTASGDDVPSYAGNTSNGLFLWGAQLTYGSAARDYFKTTDRFNVPSLDYTGATCPALSLEPARTNLFIRSEEFDNVAWSKNACTISANSIIGPDGISTADKLNTDATNAFHGLDSLALISFTLGQSYTLSIYAKAGEYSFLRMAFPSSRFTLGSVGYFDLINGVVGTTTNLTDVTITSCGNGWYRCTATATATVTGTGSLSFYFVSQSDNQGAYVGSVTSGIYIWGAQLESGAYATSYIPTTTATVSRIADSVPALLPKGTNQALQSQVFDNASWSKNAATITPNATTAPDGTLTADRLVEAVTNTSHAVLQSFTKPNGEFVYTASIYFKAGERTWAFITLDDTTVNNGSSAWFNLSTGQVGSVSGLGYTTQLKNATATVEVAANGFYRCSITAISTVGTVIRPVFGCTTGDGVLIYAGNISNGIYIWGAQFEQGDEATPYVATTTVPVHNGTVIGQTECTLYFEGSSFADSVSKQITVSDGTGNYRMGIAFNASNRIEAFVIHNVTVQADILNASFSTGTNYKIALVASTNNVFLVVDGVKIGEDLTATIPPCFRFGLDAGTGVSPFLGNLKALTLIPTALTEAQAITLTTP